MVDAHPTGSGAPVNARPTMIAAKIPPASASAMPRMLTIRSPRVPLHNTIFQNSENSRR